MSTFFNPGIALITGASTGIGSVYARRLAQRGYDLILVARDEQRLTKLADDITAKTGRKAETLAGDLTVKAELKRVEDRLRSDSRVTALVNNAGFGGAASNIKGWLLTILRNVWLNQLRGRRNSPEMVQMELGDGVVTDVVQTSKGPHNLYVGKMEAGQARAAIEELPILFREVILLREYERSSYQDMASVMDCPIGTVMSRLARARARLRSLLPASDSRRADNHFYCVKPSYRRTTPAANRGSPFEVT